MKKYGIDNVYASRFDLIDKSAKAHKCMANISKTGKDTQIRPFFMCGKSDYFYQGQKLHNFSLWFSTFSNWNHIGTKC